MTSSRAILEKTKEAAASVLPIVGIVFVSCLALVPVHTGLMLSFLVGAAMLVLGMGLFNLGAEMSMTRIGNAIGTAMTRSKKLWLILLLSFLLGAAITVAEPDLQVLAANVPANDETKAELLDYCRRHIAKYAMPYDIEFREDLPKTLVGKVAYRVLEEEELEKLKAAG